MHDDIEVRKYYRKAVKSSDDGRGLEKETFVQLMQSLLEPSLASPKDIALAFDLAVDKNNG